MNAEGALVVPGAVVGNHWYMVDTGDDTSQSKTLYVDSK